MMKRIFIGVLTLVPSLSVCVFGIGLIGCGSSPHLVKRSQMHMGTLVFLTAVAPDQQVAHKAIEKGFSEIHRLEVILSTWMPESELSRVNDAAGKTPIKVSDETIEVLEYSLEMDHLTEGGFNIAIGPAVDAWNVSREGRVPTQQELNAVRPLINLANLHINHKAKTVYLADPGMRIDIGGIGKGYAADLAVAVMQQVGATAGVVAISGDIKTFGRMPEGKRFQFGIQHPRKEPGQLLARLALEDEAVSTAGDYERYFERDGVRYHHILDPQTLKTARLSQSVTIVATEGVVADGLDTGIFVMGPDRGLALIESLPGVEGVIVGANGTVFVSTGLQNRIMMESDSNVVP
ncbi:MAG: FAD:protein FMN transferase [Nitrospirota bacterium]|nr:FAD:protein FMN transferase [Nitrospirota bacterium]